VTDPVVQAALKERVDAEIERRRAHEDAEQLSESLREYVPQAWKTLKPDEPYQHNWHIDAICDHLEAVSRGEILRLQIWVPRASMKSLTVSVFWPTWEWARDPWLRYWTASYELGLAGRLSGLAQSVIKSPWYQQRWGPKYRMVNESTKYCRNSKGGTRLATAPGSTALGEHGHRIIIDDAINAEDADATSRFKLDGTNEWYNATVMGSRAAPATTAIVIIMQRLHEDDIAAHAMRMNPDDWTVLCLPERYESDHPYAWRGDPRTEGELLWPNHRPDFASEEWIQSLGSHRAAGQAQQRPAAREGDILKRYWWRFYDPRLFTDERMKSRRPRFSNVIQTVDAPQKDKQVSDRVAIQAWGVCRGDRYLLDLKVGQMNYNQARRAILEQGAYVRKMWPRSAHHILIENAGYGVELIEELKREITGIKKMTPALEGDKILRAESAASDLESGNCFLPGYRMGQDELAMPDESRTPADILGFIDECAMFPNGRYDDQVDAWSQGMNWLRKRMLRSAKVYSSFAGT
jgi:predicted phage terminase large subunit-like protein